jgi:hypothetical protein
MIEIKNDLINLFNHFEHSNFEFVSDFDIRISDLSPERS